MASKKARGKRAKTRHKLTRQGSRNTVNKMLKQLRVGTRVQIKIDSSVHSAMPHPRFQGLTGVITGKIGDSYTMEIKDGDLLKYLIVHPAHLVAVKDQISKTQSYTSQSRKEEIAVLAAAKS